MRVDDDPAVKGVKKALSKIDDARSFVDDARATTICELDHLRAEAVAVGDGKLGAKLEAEWLNAICDLDDACDMAKMTSRRLKWTLACIRRAVRKAEKKYPTGNPKK